MVTVHVLADNTEPQPGFETEWGLSLAIRLDPGPLWLWDTGQSDLFLRSAARMGLDVGHAAGVAISHGHFDHAGGLAPLLADTVFRGPVHAHPSFLQPRYKVVVGEAPRAIGVPGTVPRPVPGFRTVESVAVLAPGLRMVTGITRRPPFHQHIQGFFLDPQGQESDRIVDDALLVVTTTPEPTVILGCCHSGLANSLEHVRDTLGLHKIQTVIGGLHLGHDGEDAWEEVAGVLDRFGVERVHAGHCTGEEATRYLAGRLPGRIYPLGTGTVLTL